MNKSPSFQFYPKDWFDYKVTRMTYEAQGIYFRILCYMWKDSSDQCSMPKSEKELARILGISTRKLKKNLAQIQQEIDPLFEETETYYISKRLREEANKQKDWRDKSRLGGLRSAKKRVKKQVKGGSGMVDDGEQPKGNSSFSSSSSTSVKNNTSCPNSDEIGLAKLLFDLIRERKPNFREPDLLKWAVHINRLIRIDKRTLEQIESIIRWCQQDDFWQNNILSTEKLRKQIDQLELKAGKQAQSAEAKLMQQAEYCHKDSGHYCIVQNGAKPEPHCKYCKRYQNQRKEDS